MTEEELKQQTETPESQETETQNQKNDSAQTAQNQTTEENQTKENSTAENAEPNAGASSDSEEEKPQELTDAQKMEQLEKENAELKDQLLRRAADFDNYRKRMIKEKQETFDYANANLLADLLDSLDNFDRTLEAGATATDVKSIVDGIKMVNGNLVKMLETKYGLSSFAAEGDDFNPDVHEAIGRVEEDVTKETLKQVYLKGYKLKDKVIRNAKVMVSIPKN